MKNQHSVISNFKDKLSSHLVALLTFHHFGFQILEKERLTKIENVETADFLSGGMALQLQCSHTPSARQRPCTEAMGGYICTRGPARWWPCASSPVQLKVQVS